MTQKPKYEAELVGLTGNNLKIKIMTEWLRNFPNKVRTIGSRS